MSDVGKLTWLQHSPSDDAAGLQRFNDSLTRALNELPTDGLRRKWDCAADLLDRVVVLGQAWGDAGCGRVLESVDQLLSQPEKRSAPGEDDVMPEAENVAGSCAALCELLDAACVGLPVLRRPIRRTLSQLLSAVFVNPPPLPEELDAPLVGSEGAAESFRTFATAGLWCQRGREREAAPGPPDWVARKLLKQVTRRKEYLEAAGVKNLVDEAINAVADSEPHDVCEFLADYFRARAEDQKVDVAKSRTVAADGATVYFSRKLGLQQAEDMRAAAADMAPVLESASPFGYFQCAAADSGRRFSAGSLHRHEVYPVAKRLTSVFLTLLGRDLLAGQGNGSRSWDRDPSKDHLFHVPLLRLRQPLADFRDDMREVVLNAHVIDRIANEFVEDDDLFRADFPKGVGPSAEEIYGDGEFRIVRRELWSLEQSTIVVTSGCLTVRFLAELGRFTTVPSTAWFFSLFRSVPLSDIGSPEPLAHLRRVFSNSFEVELLAVSQTQADVAKLRRVYDTSGGVVRHKLADKLASAEHVMHQHRLWRDNARAALEYLQRSDLHRIAARLQTWLQGVLRAPREYGFDSRQLAVQATNRSLAELATNMCVAQQGYFFVDGVGRGQNQLCSKPPQPVLFLSATGIDFNTPSTTALEAPKYFMHEKGGVEWWGFQPGAELRLLERVKLMYISIFAACQHNGVKNPSMLGMGLGAFLLNVHPSHRNMVRALYFKAQFELLSEKDWGFDVYYLNAGGFNQQARETLEAGIRDGTYNHPQRGRFLRCSVTIHSRDAKFLAVELSKRRRWSAVLNPSDCAGLLLGCVGNHWETGRCGYYGGEEDFAATGTGVLAHSGISDTLLNVGRCHYIDVVTQQLAQPIRQELPDQPELRSSPSPATVSPMPAPRQGGLRLKSAAMLVSKAHRKSPTPPRRR